MNRIFERISNWSREHFWLCVPLILTVLVTISIDYLKILSLYEGVQILLMVTLVFVTWKYALETAAIRKANTETVEQMRIRSERPYMVALIKGTVRPIEAMLGRLIGNYEKREFDWYQVDESQVKAISFEVKELELLESNNRYYIPWPPLTISGPFGQVTNDSDVSYYAYLLERNNHLKELIDLYNPEAEKFWAQLCELAVVLAKSALRRALRELLTTRRQEFNLSDDDFSRFEQAAQEYSLYLASSKLLMESEVYAKFMATNWSGWKESKTWSLWRNEQGNLMKNIIEDRSVKQLQASILQQSKTLAGDARSIKDEVLKIKKNYVWRYNILPEEIEPSAHAI